MPHALQQKILFTSFSLTFSYWFAKTIIEAKLRGSDTNLQKTLPSRYLHSANWYHLGKNCLKDDLSLLARAKTAHQ